MTSTFPKILKPLVGLHISGRRWHRKSCGGTYTSCTIFANGKQLVYLKKTYGYNDHYLTMAIDWLENNGYIEPDFFPNGTSKNYGTRFVREELQATYQVTDVQRERDL